MILRTHILLITSLLQFFLLYSCYQGVKGKFLSSLEIGTNSNQISIWISYSNSNYIFYSFQEVFSSQIDQEIKNFLDDNFSPLFCPNSTEVYIANQLPGKLKILSSSPRESLLLDEIPLTDNSPIVDFIINSDGSGIFVVFNSETQLGDYVYSVFFYKRGISKLESMNIKFTNIVRIDSDDSGNFYIFQLLQPSFLKVDVFTSAFLMMPSVTIDPNEIGFSNTAFSSAIVLKPFLFLLKFDSTTNPQRAFIFSFDYNSKDVKKKFEVSLQEGNFAMLTSLKNNLVACATFRNNFPTVIFFDPYEPTFRISHQIPIDLQYPTIARGFKVSREGKLIVSFLDAPDNKLIFYQWDLTVPK